MLKTRNEAWGFYGTIAHHANADAAWAEAFRQIAMETGASDIAIRDFLDGVPGRHFADDVANGLFLGVSLADSVAASIARWQVWKISRATSREHGIPVGMRYLLGWVSHFEITKEGA